MDALPEELQLRIFELLDSSAPSKRNARQEPDLDFTFSNTHVLKDISRASKRCRRIVLPLLFKYSRLRVDAPVRQRWLDCQDCAHLLPASDVLAGGSLEVRDEYHRGMMQASPRTWTIPQTAHVEAMREAGINNAADSIERTTKTCAAGIYHESNDFISFIELEGLADRISSLIVMSDDTDCGVFDDMPVDGLSYDWRYEAAAAMWQQILSVVNPESIAILAPPGELACLANASVSMRASLTSAWAFEDMDFHLLQLRCDRSSSNPTLTSPISYGELEPLPDPNGDLAPASIINLREWTHLALNEGSFLRAYGTYEYFERGPPSLIRSINSCVFVKDSKGFYHARPALHKLRSLTYTAIFPFANHMDFLGLLPQLETLDLQFAPTPQAAHILDDPCRTGRVDPQDCWQELMSGYHDIATALSTSQMSKEAFPRLRTFICRDAHIELLRDDFDHIFTPLCLPVWAEYEPGVFRRIADKAHFIGGDAII